MKKITCLFHTKKILSLYLHNFLTEQKKVYHHPTISSVHRMRVASRRLRVALNTFQYLKLLPLCPAKKAIKQISQVSRPLGKARELDVQLKFLLSLKQPIDKNGFKKLAAILKKDRKKAQKKNSYCFRHSKEKQQTYKNNQPS